MPHNSSLWIFEYAKPLPFKSAPNFFSGTLSLSDSMITIQNTEITYSLTSHEYDSDLWLFATKKYEIANYISKYDLSQYLCQCYERINQFFPNCKTEIELTTDTIDNEKMLFIYLFTNLPIKQSTQQMLSLFKNWDLIQNKRFHKHVSIVSRKM